eukprot:TRINITY_DN3226_c1_g1_i1.p1 TRINITY_DN3226_c1_g1~~TRINITY_DN3226_c1_g1_i1.p1  ORF type:complete len:268 (+),score=56.23 TRINITY_DN3226_c1_g1_i1:69-872(+)
MNNLYEQEILFNYIKKLLIFYSLEDVSNEFKNKAHLSLLSSVINCSPTIEDTTELTRFYGLSSKDIDKIYPLSHNDKLLWYNQFNNNFNELFTELNSLLLTNTLNVNKDIITTLVSKETQMVEDKNKLKLKILSKKYELIHKLIHSYHLQKKILEKTSTGVIKDFEISNFQNTSLKLAKLSYDIRKLKYSWLNSQYSKSSIQSAVNLVELMHKTKERLTKQVQELNDRIAPYLTLQNDMYYQRRIREIAALQKAIKDQQYILASLSN